MKAFGLILQCSNEIVFDKNVNKESLGRVRITFCALLIR